MNASTQLTASEEFFGLRSRPFSLTPDLRFTYHSRSHTQALEQITVALKRREGLVVVTGEVGTGKTMLCRALLDTFEARTFQSVILDPLLTVEDLLHQVLADFGLMKRPERSLGATPLTHVVRHDLVTTLHKFLATLISLDAHAVIMIDEAQHLSGSVLEQVRLLSNFETDSAKLLQIVLVGQPNLDLMLRRPDLQQLNQRVARRFDLQPLSDTEIRDYIERRLLVASSAPPEPGRPTSGEAVGEATVQFTPGAIRAVQTLSRGIPRLVNTVCDRALEAAYERRERTVDKTAVLVAAQRLKLPVPAVMRFPPAARIAAAALVVVGTMGGAWWWSRSGARIAGSTTTSVPSTPPGPALAPAQAPPPEPEAPAQATPPPSVPQETAPAPQTVDSLSRTAVAAGSGGYEITAASFKTEQRATAVTASLASSGLPVASKLDASGTWYRIVVGPFRTSEDARAAQVVLVREGFADTRITLRATAGP